ncbi:hypothetical protein C8P68_102530 [Mucilaginibacter yixingensis]|uniref:Outer membrane protein with beta-barrel domain n=1 Tax=Mucilaginibacter yixingensis TaxID=1295612 RepID=A0A2T5JD55_9SPHI|nr:hypothetical protein [Mucilaginibacter yixingensis]PTQ99701.1 hypothetical protein C8P68_102530 [Mucilaginibacter yixingensis]
MKSLTQYLKLWQKKRDELPVNTDAAADWVQMQQMLNQHLPVTHPPSSALKFLKGTGFKTITAALLTPGVAALVYVAVHHASPKLKDKKQHDSVKVIEPMTNQRQLDSVQTAQIQNPDNSVSAHTDTANVNVNTASANGSTGQVNAVMVAGGKRLVVTNSVGQTNASSAGQTSVLVGGPSSVHQAGIQASPGGHHRQVNGINYMQPGGQIAGYQSAAYGTKDNDRQGKAADGSGGATANSNGVQGGLLNDPSAAWQPLVAQPDDWRTVSSSFMGWRDVPISGAAPNLILTTRPLGRLSKLKVSKIKEPKVKSIKTPGSGQSTPTNVDWGLLIGTGLPGASGLGDISPGAFVSFDVRSRWAINAQVRLFNPQKLNGSYTHKNESKKDTLPKILTINDSRTVYSAQIPVYLEYKATENLRIKAGGVVSLPIRQARGSSKLSPDTIRKDSAYFAKTMNTLGGTKYEAKINFGISAGVALHYNRFLFEATYLHPLKPQKVSSDLGSYTSGGNQLQLTIGFKLNKRREEGD